MWVVGLWRMIKSEGWQTVDELNCYWFNGNCDGDDDDEVDASEQSNLHMEIVVCQFDLTVLDKLARTDGYGLYSW